MLAVHLYKQANFQGKIICHVQFCFPSKLESTLRGNEMLVYERTLFCRSRHEFEWGLSSKKANRKSQTLFPCVKWLKNIYLSFHNFMTSNTIYTCASGLDAGIACICPLQLTVSFASLPSWSQLLEKTKCSCTRELFFVGVDTNLNGVCRQGKLTGNRKHCSPMKNG